MQDLASYSWYQYLTPYQQELINIALELKKDAEFRTANSLSNKIADYSYLVFPIAKCYEGFLKKYFLDFGLITAEIYDSKRFRVGRAFNPDISESQRDELWLYDDVAKKCGEDLARELWEAWILCRNRVFHYFPHQEEKLSLLQAQERIDLLLSVMERAYQCQLITNK